MHLVMGLVWSNFIKKYPYTHKIARLGKHVEKSFKTHTFFKKNMQQ
jgi:hypothetical protein